MDSLLILQLIIGLVIGAWISANARDRKADRNIQIGLFLAGLFFGMIALILYWIFRPSVFRKK